jgi:hypothetical protein
MDTEIEIGLTRLNNSGFNAVYQPQVIGFRGNCMDIPIRYPEYRDTELMAGYFEIEPIEDQWVSRILYGMVCIRTSSDLDVAINSVIDFFRITRRLGEFPGDFSLPLFVCQKSGLNVSVISDREIILRSEISNSEQRVQAANAESDSLNLSWKILIDDQNQFLITRKPALSPSEEPICFSSLKEAIDHILNEHGKTLQDDVQVRNEANRGERPLI